MKANRKVDWAAKRFDDLLSLDSEFGKRHPYRLDFAAYDDGRPTECFVKELLDLPPDFILLTADVIHNLRCGLDHAVYDLLQRRRGTKDMPKRTGFPISKCCTTYEKSTERLDIQRFIGDQVECFDRLEPYRGGNDLLWKLHELNNTDKHRLLLTAYTGWATAPVDGPIIWRFEPLYVGKVLYRLTAKEQVETMHSFAVTFNEPDVAQGDPVVSTLLEMLKHVREIVAAIDLLRKV